MHVQRMCTLSLPTVVPPPHSMPVSYVPYLCATFNTYVMSYSHFLYSRPGISFSLPCLLHLHTRDNP